MSNQEEPDSGETIWDVLGCLVHFFENRFIGLLNDPVAVSRWLLNSAECRRVDRAERWFKAKRLDGLAKQIVDEYRCVTTEANELWRKFRDADGDKGEYRPGPFFDCDRSIVANQAARFAAVIKDIQSDMDGPAIDAPEGIATLSDEDALAKLEAETPGVVPKSGKWVSNKEAAAMESLATRSLATYRNGGLHNGNIGKDKDGRVWRRLGGSKSHPWYLKSTLTSQRKA